MKVYYLKRMLFVVPFFLLWIAFENSSWGQTEERDPDQKGKQYHGHVHEVPGPRHRRLLHGEHKEPIAVPKEPKVAPKAAPEPDMLITSMAYPTGSKDCC
ncbi:MAG: hypothetical protein E3K37_16455, partial [Candidatus Kuenenia sp.]|nr:hypothetical protein [Candidatus Kuenenia hertensis]